MSDNLTCANNTAAKTVTAAVKALSDFKNPYNTSTKAVRSSKSFSNDGDVGFTSLAATGSTVNVRTCFVVKCNATTNLKRVRLVICHTQ